MAFSQADLDALKAAIAEAGTTSEVRFSDNSLVRYISTTEAVTLLRLMEADVQKAASDAAVVSGGASAPRAFRASFGGGW